MGRPPQPATPIVLVVINVVPRTTRAIADVYISQVGPVAKTIVCRSKADLDRLHPKPHHWNSLRFVLSEGVITPEYLAAWVLARAPKQDFVFEAVETAPTDRRKAAREAPRSFVARFCAAFDRLQSSPRRPR